MSTAEYETTAVASVSVMTTPSGKFTVVVAAEPNADRMSVPAACSGDVGTVVISARGVVAHEMNPRDRSPGAVRKDVGVEAFTEIRGRKTETAGVDAGVLSLDERTGGPLPSSE